MIFDKLSNISRYKDLFKEVIDFCNSKDLQAINTGKHTVSDNCFALVNEYKTAQNDEFIAENHRQYIDLQLMVKGTEIIQFAGIEKLQLHKSYNPEDDYELYSGEGTPIVLEQNYFAVFFPDEAHQPMLSVDAETDVRKIVFKIKVQ